MISHVDKLLEESDTDTVAELIVCGFNVDE